MADMVGGAIVTLVSIWLVLASGGLPSGTAGIPGAGFFPKLVGAAGIVTGVLLMLYRRPKAPEGESAESTWSRGLGKVLGIVAVASAYVLWFERVPFLIASPVMLFLVLLVLGERRVLPLLAFPAVVSALVYGLFALTLDVPLR